ncbi:MAG: hypothetical protein U0P46_03480 [Holophagaceae bacterium]
MFSTFVLAFGLLVALNCFANDGPAISESTRSSRYPGKVKSLVQADFKESIVMVRGKSFKLHHGAFKKFRHGAGGIEIELINSWVVPSKQGTPQLAFLYFVQTRIGGSSSKTGFVQMLAIENSQLVIKHEYSFIPLDIPHVCDFDPSSGELTIVAKSDDLSPAFAPEQADHVLYRLAGDQLELVAWKTVSTKLP